jgi:hypothetical protein
MNLWVDDTRDAPDHTWVVARNYDDAMHYLRGHQVVMLSLDHDLGYYWDGKINTRFNPTEKTGYDICKSMVDEGLWPKFIYFHTMNPVGEENMRQLLTHYAPEGVKIG